MSVLDGKQVVTLGTTVYQLQTPPHATAPWAQNQAFFAALAATQTPAAPPTVSANTTLTAAQSGTFLQLTGATAAQTVSLPTASSAPGVRYTIQNLATATWSLTSAGGNIVVAGFAAGLTHVMSAFVAAGNMTTLTVRSNGTNWYIYDLNGTLAS